MNTNFADVKSRKSAIKRIEQGVIDSKELALYYVTTAMADTEEATYKEAMILCRQDVALVYPELTGTEINNTATVQAVKQQVAILLPNRKKANRRGNNATSLIQTIKLPASAEIAKDWHDGNDGFRYLVYRMKI